jgi:hypothetical protein
MDLESPQGPNVKGLVPVWCYWEVVEILIYVDCWEALDH